MTLNPRESFTIVRQIEDHTDSSTYYVRAVIRNAKTDAIITVNGNNYLNLTDQTGRRFSASWLVPADPSGQGFYVSILTSVYEDSGYTTKSVNYGDKMDVYLVQDRMNPNLGGMGGGSDIDYKRIRKIVKEVVGEIEPSEPKIVEVVKEVIKEVKIPVKTEIIREVIREVKVPIKTETIREVIKEIKVPEIIKVNLPTDLKPLDIKVDKIIAFIEESKRVARDKELAVVSPYTRVDKLMRKVPLLDKRAIKLLK